MQLNLTRGGGRRPENPQKEQMCGVVAMVALTENESEKGGAQPPTKNGSIEVTSLCILQSRH